MGHCPCPRCLITKNCAHQLGTKNDKRQRKSLARVDNLQYQVKISSARDIIYQNNRKVDSKLVQNFLKPQSLVPTEVCIYSISFNFNKSQLYHTECIFKTTFSSWIQLFFNFPGRFYA